jgi:hypothetical protein
MIVRIRDFEELDEGYMVGEMKLKRSIATLECR